MLSEQIKELEEKVERLEKLLYQTSFENGCLKAQIEKYKELAKDVIPNQVYTHKKRRNTTVKFLSGKSVTVKRHTGEKDCLETAIAYCIMKSVLSPKDIDNLIKNVERH